jgi:hypothetical protein
VLRWTKGGYFIHSRREKGGVVVKRAGTVVYRLFALSPDGIIFQYRVEAADGSVPPDAVGWDYDRRTGQYALVGPPTIPVEIIEAINEVLPKDNAPSDGSYAASQLIDLFLRTPLDFWRMLAYGVRAVIEAIH